MLASRAGRVMKSFVKFDHKASTSYIMVTYKAECKSNFKYLMNLQELGSQELYNHVNAIFWKKKVWSNGYNMLNITRSIYSPIETNEYVGLIYSTVAI